jgi:hypothetical protein
VRVRAREGVRERPDIERKIGEINETKRGVGDLILERFIRAEEMMDHGRNFGSCGNEFPKEEIDWSVSSAVNSAKLSEFLMRAPVAHLVSRSTFIRHNEQETKHRHNRPSFC